MMEKKGDIRSQLEVPISCSSCIHSFDGFCLMAKKPNKKGQCRHYFKGVSKIPERLVKKYLKNEEKNWRRWNE